MTLPEGRPRFARNGPDGVNRRFFGRATGFHPSPSVAQAFLCHDPHVAVTTFDAQAARNTKENVGDKPFSSIKAVSIACGRHNPSIPFDVARFLRIVAAPPDGQGLIKHILSRPTHYAEEGARLRLECALGNRFDDRMELKPAREELLDLFRREAVRPLCFWLEVAKALQKEVCAWLKQTSNGVHIVRLPLRWQDVEAPPVEDEVKLLVQVRRQNIILLPVDKQPLGLGISLCAANGGFGKIDGGNIKAAASELHCLSSWPSP